MTARPPPRFNPADSQNRPRRTPPGQGGTLTNSPVPSPNTGAGAPPPAIRTPPGPILSSGPPPLPRDSSAPAPLPRSTPPPLAPRTDVVEPPTSPKVPPPISRDDKPGPPPISRDDKPAPPVPVSRDEKPQPTPREDKPAPVPREVKPPTPGPARTPPTSTMPPRSSVPPSVTRSTYDNGSNGTEDVDALKSKIKKAEVDLKKADDIIVSQEDEIKRLNDIIENLNRGRSSSSAESDSPRGSLSKSTGKKKAVQVQEPPKKPTSSRNMTALSGSTGGAVAVKHEELRKGTAMNAFSDLSIVLPSGTVTAHACLITARCPFLDKQLQDRYGGKKKVPKKKEIQIKHSDIASVNRMVDFLYSDDDSFVTRCSPADLFNIATTAKKFGVDRLLWICENFFVNGITLSNVVPLLKSAAENKDERVKAFCLDFLLKPENFQAFVVRKDLTTELGMELFTEVVTMNTTALVSGRPATPAVSQCPPSTYSQDMRAMYETMQYPDAYVKIENDSIHFHKAILSAASEKIYGAFTKAKFVAGHVDDASECMLVSKEQKFHEKVSPDAFKAMLRYVYYGDTEIDPYSACQLIPVTRFYGLLELQELCERRMRDAVTNSKVVMKILGTTYLAMMAGREEMRDQLRGQCISHIVGHLKEVDLSSLREMDKEQAVEASIDIIVGCQKRYG